jgi:hypothetical protein
VAEESSASGLLLRGNCLTTLLTGMRQAEHIAELFLALNGHHENARERAERFIEALKDSRLWEPDEIDELRRIIDAGLAPSE